jgi:hypothetical protein
MNVKIWGGVALLLIVATNASGARNNIQNSNEVRTERTEARRAERDLSREARRREKLSSVALDRVKAGCIPVGYLTPEIPVAPYGLYKGITETALTEGLRAEDGFGVPLSDNTFVCNSRGDTAVVMGGVLTNLVTVNPNDRAEYSQYFEAQLP